MPDSDVAPFLRSSTYVSQMLDRTSSGATVADPRAAIGNYLRTRQYDPAVLPALSRLSLDVKTQVEQYGSFRRLPNETVQNVRNDMYLSAEAIRRLSKEPTVKFAKADADLLKAYRTELDAATRFIPVWVKVSVAIALGLGTMVGWKRIDQVTVTWPCAFSARLWLSRPPPAEILHLRVPVRRRLPAMLSALQAVDCVEA